MIHYFIRVKMTSLITILFIQVSKIMTRAYCLWFCSCAVSNSMFYVRKTLTYLDEYVDYGMIYFQNILNALGFVPQIPDRKCVNESTCWCYCLNYNLWQQSNYGNYKKTIGLQFLRTFGFTLNYTPSLLHVHLNLHLRRKRIV